jgi:hypothetical protein
LAPEFLFSLEYTSNWSDQKTFSGNINSCPDKNLLIEVGLKRQLISLTDKLQKRRSQNIEEWHESGDGVLVLVF